jgi:hypothetical protein
MIMVFRPSFCCSDGMPRPVWAYDLSGRTRASCLRAGHGLGLCKKQCDRQVRHSRTYVVFRSYVSTFALTSENASSDHGISETRARLRRRNGGDGAD